MKDHVFHVADIHRMLTLKHLKFSLFIIFFMKPCFSNAKNIYRKNFPWVEKFFWINNYAVLNGNT